MDTFGGLSSNYGNEPREVDFGLVVVMVVTLLWSTQDGREGGGGDGTCGGGRALHGVGARVGGGGVGGVGDIGRICGGGSPAGS